MREHKDRRVIRRLVTPPALPFIGPTAPVATYRTKHISPKNVRADILKTPCGNVVVNTRLAIFTAMHPLPGAGGKEPVKNFESAHAERILQVLMRSRAETVNRD